MSQAPNDTKQRRVRFAPSPTGVLHIGSVRTALFNWVYARHIGATYILRIEDTDQKRSESKFEDNILAGLNWLGLSPDEGPEQGGNYGPYRQSERIEAGIYEKYARQLVEKGLAYYCFESEEELAEARDAAREAGVAYRYNGPSRDLSPEQVKSRLDAGDSYTIRFDIPQGRKIRFKDRIRGEMEFESDLLSDFIILKSDGSPSYHFAVVVDDSLMEITDVIRGEDHLSNTPRHILLAQALDFPVPKYAHLPIILGPDKSKLSKRHGATAVSDYQAEGYLPDALLNYLSLLGWSPKSGQEKMSRETLIDCFDISRVSKSGAIFDIQKLKWMNGQYIRDLEGEPLWEVLSPFIGEEIRAALGNPTDDQLKDMIPGVRDQLARLCEINDDLMIYSPDLGAYKDRMTEFELDEEQVEIIRAAESVIKNSPNFTADLIESMINEVMESLSLKKGRVMKTFRIAATGYGSGPYLPDLVMQLGKDCLLGRLATITGA